MTWRYRGRYALLAAFGLGVLAVLVFGAGGADERDRPGPPQRHRPSTVFYDGDYYRQDTGCVAPRLPDSESWAPDGRWCEPGGSVSG
jgi:hypothetical protein